MYVILSSFHNIKFYDKYTRKEIPFYEVQNKLGLDKVRDLMNRSKITTLSYLKELFVNDYEGMNNLINLHDINFMCKEKIKDLYNKGENSIAQILIRERKLNRLKDKFNETKKEYFLYNK